METVAGIRYDRPKVYLLQDTGLGTAEFAARTAYDSFNLSENNDIKYLNQLFNNPDPDLDMNATIYNVTSNIHDIHESELLNSLAWTYFHHSVLEHVVLTYSIKGTSRGVLQELARHRIASPTVRSTRYTMSDVLYAYLCSKMILDELDQKTWFAKKLEELDIFVNKDMYFIEAVNIINRLDFQKDQMGQKFILSILSDGNREKLKEITVSVLQDREAAEELYRQLKLGKKKRNVGDNFKGIVNDNWKTDLVFTINLRSLKNLFDLRDSGSAWFQIRWLAEEIKKATPKKYLKLIVKNLK